MREPVCQLTPAVGSVRHDFQFFYEQFMGIADWDAHRAVRPSPRRERRTRGMTIEQRRLEQALSGKPITVRPSAQNHAWKKRR
jgi:hypothetical protein